MSAASDRHKLAREVKYSRRRCCRVCGWAPPGGLSPTLLHAHHVIPRHSGGTDDRRNLVILCPNHHAIAHKLWPVSRPGTYEGRPYEGPVIASALVWLLRAFEEDPEAYYEAQLRLALDPEFGSQKTHNPPATATGEPACSADSPVVSAA